MDDSQAVAFFTQAGKANRIGAIYYLANAAYGLAECYEIGQGVEKEEEAAALYTKAGAKKHADAIFRLGSCYE